MTTPQNRTVATAGDEPRGLAVLLRNVNHYFKNYQVRALTNVTVTVRRGEVFGLLGPKGSGKSTTLGIIAGRVRPTEGNATVFDRSPRRPSIKARISYLAEAGGEMTASGWIGFFKRFFQLKQSSTGVNSVWDGSRRAQLTRALSRNADLFVLDEPFAGLDPENIREVKELIRTFAQSGTTVIVSSDSLSETKDVCDRFAIVVEGKVQAVGTLDQLLAAPDALRLISAVLPVTTAERALKVIREDIGARVSPASAPEHSLDASANAESKIPQAQPAATATAAESILTSLLKANTPAPQAKPSSGFPEAESDPVNHRKLAELTRSAADSPSSSKTA